MTKVRLELEKLEILRPKERWQLYFVVVAEHPTNPDQMIITTLPEGYFRLKPIAENTVHFEPEGDGNTEGLIVLERNMPESRSLKVRVYLRHGRKTARDAGAILQDIMANLGGDAVGIVTGLLGKSTPWLAIASKALPMIGQILTKIPDRDFGFVNMDEVFGDDFENQTEQDRTNTFSSGDAKIVWSWSVS